MRRSSLSYEYTKRSWKTPLPQSRRSPLVVKKVNLRTKKDAHEQRPTLSSEHLADDSQPLPPWFKEIPREGVLAFTQAIRLLEFTGEDKLKAEQLQEKLSQVDSSVTLLETQSALKGLKRDADGNVDFEQFMGFMCPSRKVTVPGGKKTLGFTRRQRLFYSAFFLTLKQLYADSRAKSQMQIRVKSKSNLEMPGCALEYKGSMQDYTVSMTRRVENELKKVQSHLKDANKPFSPYAQSMLTPAPDQVHRGSPLAPKKSFLPQTSNLKKLRSRTTPKEIKFAKAKRRSLWNEHNVYIHKLNLPVLKVHNINSGASFNDLPKIRKQITKEFGQYYGKLRDITAENAGVHWNKVYTESVKPHKMMKDFKDVFWSYSKKKPKHVFVHSEVLPNPCLNAIKVG